MVAPLQLHQHHLCHNNHTFNFKLTKPLFQPTIFLRSPVSIVIVGHHRQCHLQVQVNASSQSHPPSFPFRPSSKKRVDESGSLTLDSIRQNLIRQEDSIIFSLLERAQYSYNEDTYDHDAFFMDGFNGSLVEYMVCQTEKLHAQVGRYNSPDEHAFFPTYLPDPMLPPLKYPQVLHHSADSININNKIWNMYFKGLLPRLVKAGDDGNCGSAAVCDTLCVQDFYLGRRKS